MYQRILVPLDGSKFAMEALPLSRLLAEKIGAGLHFVHVIPPTLGLEGAGEGIATHTEIREAVQGYLQDIAQGEGAATPPTTTAVLEGVVGEELHSYIEREAVDLVTMTSHGTGGIHRWWRGSVAEDLLTAGGADLLMIQPWDETEDLSPGTARFSRILVPLDGSEYSEKALPRAQELATLFGADLLLVQVVPSPIELTSIYGVPGVEIAGASHLEKIEGAERYLEKIGAQVMGGRCETHVIESPGAAEGIVECARDLGADLIVISGHGRSGMERFVLGSITDKVLRGTTRPVLVVRPPHS